MARKKQVRLKFSLPLTLPEHRRVRKNPLPFLEFLAAKKANSKHKGYTKQFVYLIQAYNPETKKIENIYPFRTFETFKNILDSLKAENLWPLLSPNPIRVPKEFWEEYRQVAYRDPEATVKLAVKHKLLKDSAIDVLKIFTIDVDSPFEDVYPAWRELLSLLELQKGYRVFKTKSGRFRAYICLNGTKDFKRARELLAIIYAFFERKGLKADHTFVGRLNHPVFYEDFPLYNYELVESVEGANDFYELYRKVKEFQRELELWTFKGKNLTEEFWGKKPPAKTKKKECKVLKAPAFVRRLQENTLDNFELWKRAVTSLAEKHDSYRYVHVIQPAIGWAKWLELPKEEVTEFLLEFLGEEKRKDIEKGWRYARELEFKVNDTVRWKGKTREEWEKKVESYIKSREEVTRQELLREVFSGQVWLLELIVGGIEKKGKIESYFVKAGRGRPKKVYKLVAEVQQGVEAVAVGAEDFSQNNNSLQRVMGGWLDKPGITGSGGYTGGDGESSVKVYGEFSGSLENERKEGEERRKSERASDLTAVAENKNLPKNQQNELELPPELQGLMQKAEQAQKEGNLQRLAGLFRNVRWYEMEFYQRDRELCRLVEQVLLLSNYWIGDVVRRVIRVLLLPCQREFIERYLDLRAL